KEGVADAIVKRPAKRDFPRLSRGKLRHDWTVTRDLHIESHIRFPLDVNYFVPNLRGFPALRREVLSLSIKCFDIRVFNCRTYVRTSPRNPPVVTDNYIGIAGQRHSSDIEISRTKVSGVPEIWHLVPEMHIVREQRLAGCGVRAGNHPVVGTQRRWIVAQKFVKPRAQ